LKPKKVLLKDIAKIVGVSSAAVSYVLNEHPMAARIGKEVAEKIRKTATELNYQPNQIARSLKTQKTYTIGLIVADIANPFSAQIARIIEDAAKQQGYTVLFGSSDENPEKEQGLIRTMMHRQVDGIIIAAVGHSEEQLHDLESRGLPFVLIDRYFPGENFSYVAIDNYRATYEAVQLLLSKGRTRIGLVSLETELFHLLERNRGYREALETHAIPIQPAFQHSVPLHRLRDEVEAGISRMLEAEEPIDALLFTTNLLALHGLRALKLRQIEIPRDIAVIAFDEADFYDLFPVSVTHISQPLEELGLAATDSIIREIARKGKPTQVLLPARLVLGASSG